MAKIYGYARISTAEQREDRQLAALLEKGVSMNKIYVDKQIGRSFDRSAYKLSAMLLLFSVNGW